MWLRDFPLFQTTVAATSDSHARIKSRRKHPRIVHDGNCREDSRTGAKSRPDSRGPEIGTHLHGSVYASHRRPIDVITNARRTKSFLSPIAALSRVHVSVISGRVWRRRSRHREKLSEYRAIWSRTREVDRHFVNQTYFFSSLTRTSPVMQRARHLVALRPHPFSPPISRCQGAKAFETRQRIGREPKGEGRREDARIA